MGIKLALKELPGYMTLKALYDKLPGTGVAKALVVAAGVGATIVGAIALGAIGITALLSAGAALISAPLIVQLGIIAALPILFTLIIAGIQYIYNFNFAASDKELDKQIKDSFNKFYGMTGEAIGTAMGYLVCGVLPGALSFAFSPAVARVALSNVSEEARDEIYSQLATIAQNVFATYVNAMILKAYKGARKWLKRVDSPPGKLLLKAMGSKRMAEWGVAEGQSYTLASKQEELIETIKDENTKNFVEEFLEAFGQSCTEASYIVVNSAASQMAIQALMNRKAGLATDEEAVLIDFNPVSSSTTTGNTTTTKKPAPGKS